jgi:16S rRNA (uracil1498-N3)-methyltransferase
MQIRRFYVNPCDIIGNTVKISGGEFHHLKDVLRLKVGFDIIVCANDGFDRYCKITEIAKDFAAARVEKKVEREKKNLRLRLYCALLKNNKLDFVVQKAVELGVDEIVPFVSKNTSETKFNLERAQKIALEAAKQCGSASLTKIFEPCAFDDILTQFSEFDSVVMPYENERENALSLELFDSSNGGLKSVALIIGSEGGFTQDEVEKAKNQGIKTVSLGKRILRADTASIVAAALVLFLTGELRP